MTIYSCELTEIMYTLVLSPRIAQHMLDLFMRLVESSIGAGMAVWYSFSTCRRTVASFMVEEVSISRGTQNSSVMKSIGQYTVS